METAMLLLRDEGGQTHHWSLDRSEILIGRHEECAISLSDRKVSRHHARILRDEAGYTLEDLGSKNGTFINGEPVTEPRRLRDGDEIGIALSLRLTFVDAEATVPLYFEASQKRPLRLDREARMVYVHDRPLSPPLSPAQFRLLELLVENRDKVVDRGEIIRVVWPESVEEGVSEQAIDALVRRLRERLAEPDPQWNYVATVRGHGFRINLPGL